MKGRKSCALQLMKEQAQIARALETAEERSIHLLFIKDHMQFACSLEMQDDR